MQIGDTIPEYLWHVPLSLWDSKVDTVGTVRLDDFREKWIVLDFWNTFCGSCIQAFPKMNNLQAQFGNAIRILSVTTEDTARLNRLLDRRPHLRASILESVVTDTSLKSIFPHQAVPYIVVVSKEGVITDFPSNSKLTERYFRQHIGNHSTTKSWKEEGDGTDF